MELCFKVAPIKLQIPIISKMKNRDIYTYALLQKINTVCLTSYGRYGTIGGLRCGVEQWQLVGLITRRSQVQVLPPLLTRP
jgi:hypothetical protein